MHYYWLGGSILFGLLIITGCKHMDRFKADVPEVDTIADIGSPRISVLSVARWSEYRDSLQPTFNINEKKALNEAIPTTRALTDQTLESVRAILKLALPTDTTTKLIEQIVADEEITRTEKTTGESKPGDISSVGEPGVPADVEAGDKLPRVGEIGKEGLDEVDPRLKYQVATALLQEVRLLDRYIHDVALRDGYLPYVIRLQITTMPRMRYLPYDTYVDLGFYENPNERKLGKPTTLPIAVPLFATDSLEATLSSAELGQLRQLGIAISSMSSTAFGGEFGYLSKRLEAALGRDINSLFTMGRLSDNVVRIRLGAMQQIRTDYAMVPRTETVTLLLMVDEKYASEKSDSTDNKRIIHIHAESEFVHVTDGTLLGPLDPKEDQKIGLKIFNRHGIDGNPESLNLFYNKLWNYILASDWSKFVLELGKLEECPGKNEGEIGEMKKCKHDKDLELEQIWSNISNIQLNFGVDTLRLQLPLYIKPQLFEPQTALLLDDEKSKTTVVFRGGFGLSSADLCAALLLYGKAKKNGETVSELSHILPSDDITVSGSGRVATINFPSLKRWEIKNLTKNPKTQVRVRLAEDNSVCAIEAGNHECNHDDNLFCSTSVNYLSSKVKEPPKAGFTVNPGTGFITANPNAIGTIRLVIKSNKPKTANKAEISIRNANLNSVKKDNLKTGTVVGNVGNSFTIDLPEAGKEMSIWLELGGLAVGENITIKAQNEKKVTADIEPLKVRYVKSEK